MDQPKISIIVPVYKVEPYLRKCLDSIIAQTYTNLEIILVNDGSPDNCGAICDEYAAKDTRIIVIHKENGGVSSARNMGLDVATGEYIGYVDSDDWIEPDMYEYLLGLAKTHDADVAQCGFWLEEDGQSLEQDVFPTDTTAFSGGAGFTCEDWDKFSYGPCCKLYRAAAVAGVRYDTNYSYGEDFVYNIQVFLRPLKIVFGAKAKYHYLQRQGSACHKEVTYEYLIACRAPFAKCWDLMKHSEAFRAQIFKHMSLNTLDFCSQLVRFHRKKATASETKEHLRTYIRENLTKILKEPSFSRKDKLKSILISYAWWLYELLLRLSKI